MMALILCLPLLLIFGCSDNHRQQNNSKISNPSSSPNSSETSQIAEHSLKLSQEEINDPPSKINSRLIALDYGGLHFLAQRDSGGYASILNYPAEWHGTARIIRFDGPSEEAPFSQEHCETIRAMNRYGGTSIARTAFYSVVKFDVPPFLSAGFLPAVRDSARQSGEYRPIFSFKNAVHRWNGKLDLKLSDASITLLGGDLRRIYEQVNLATFPGEGDDMQYQVVIRSGDILCDLVSGAATLDMSFPIEGEEKSIRVSFDKFEVKL